jgi:exosome complex component RRP4
MQELKRKYVIPGDKIVDGNFRPLMNVIRIGDSIVSTRIGIAEAGRDGIKVIPLSGVYIPRVNDIVIGKIVDRSSLSWDVDINSCFSAHLPAQDVFGRDFSPARDDMNRELATGDLITARIIAFDRTRDPMLTIQDRDLGKIPRGESMKISATRVPRLIGKRGSMIQTIEQATQTRILIGQNGIIVVTGRSPEGIGLAVKAIKMVEDEAHTSNLTQRIKVLLNVADASPQPQPTQSSPVAFSGSLEPSASSSKATTSDLGASQAESSLQMAEDILEGRPSTAAPNPHITYSSSSTSSTDHVSLPSSGAKGGNQEERSRKTEEHSSALNPTNADTRKTRAGAKRVRDEESKEHNNKEEAD